MISFLQCIIFEPISYSEFILGANFLKILNPLSLNCLRKNRSDNFWVNSGKTDHSGRVQAQTSLRPRITSQDLCALCLRRSQTLLLQRARKRAYIFKLHTYILCSHIIYMYKYVPIIYMLMPSYVFIRPSAWEKLRIPVCNVIDFTFQYNIYYRLIIMTSS